MKILFVWPFKYDNIMESLSGSPESFEFYSRLIERTDIIITTNYNEADYIFYMMDIKNCYNLPHYSLENLDKNIIKQIKSNKYLKKEVIIDYNDWTDTKNVPSNVLSEIGYYFKRSIVDKNNMTLVKYDRNIIPISYGIRTDFIQYDKSYNFKKYNYDICCMFNQNCNGLRLSIQSVINNYNNKYIGRAVMKHNSICEYTNVNTEYFEILKTSKIIVTANPTYWEGDFRLWEALLMGNLVLCDKMVVPHIIPNPIINKKHLVFYNDLDELKQLIDYYLENEVERSKIGKEGREYCLKYHKFSDRVDEVINHLK